MGIGSTIKDLKAVEVAVVIILPTNLEVLSLQKTYILEHDFIILQAHVSNSPDCGCGIRYGTFAGTDNDGLRCIA